MAGIFPTPPIEFISYYTDEKFFSGRSPGPPPVPQKGEMFSIFGAPQWNDEHIVRPLETLQIKRLYPQHFDRKRELKKAMHSVLAMFVDLTDTLIKCPRSQKRNEKLEDINLLLIHMQHLLNEYRVHQARDSICALLELQRRQTLEVTERLNFHIEKVTEIVASCAGTSTSENAQKTSSAYLKWNVAALQSRLSLLKQVKDETVDPSLCKVAVESFDNFF